MKNFKGDYNMDKAEQVFEKEASIKAIGTILKGVGTRAKSLLTGSKLKAYKSNLSKAKSTSLQSKGKKLIGKETAKVYGARAGVGLAGGAVLADAVIDKKAEHLFNKLSEKRERKYPGSGRIGNVFFGSSGSGIGMQAGALAGAALGGEAKGIVLGAALGATVGAYTLGRLGGRVFGGKFKKKKSPVASSEKLMDNARWTK